MYFDYRIHKPILAFLPFGLRSARYGPAGRGAPAACEDAPQTHLLDHSKSARGNRPKGMQKSDKKSAYIPYLDNIETTSIKIFVKTTEISGKSGIFFLNGFLSVIGSTFSYDRILEVVCRGVKYSRERGSLLNKIHCERIAIEYS